MKSLLIYKLYLGMHVMIKSGSKDIDKFTKYLIQIYKIYNSIQCYSFELSINKMHHSFLRKCKH